MAGDRYDPTAKPVGLMCHPVSPDLDTPGELAGLDLRNRLYRAPLLECAGEGPDAVDRLIDELEPAAAAGVGLICQGAMPVRREDGRVAPNMTHLAGPERAEDLRRLTDAIHDHGARVVAQLDHGGIRTLETWHRPYRAENPDLRQLAVSEPPRLLRLAERAGLLDYDLDVLSTADVYDLAADFGRRRSPPPPRGPPTVRNRRRGRRRPPSRARRDRNRGDRPARRVPGAVVAAKPRAAAVRGFLHDTAGARSRASGSPRDRAGPRSVRRGRGSRR